MYHAVVAEARRPAWFEVGGVPDTVDGRFDMVALVLSLALRRIEREERHQLAADVTDRFIADMDGSLRQMGIGDQNVGKEVGKLVSALGGRLGAYREALAEGAGAEGAGADALASALARNLYRGQPDAVALGWAAGQVAALAARLDAMPSDRFTGGRW